MTAKLRRFDLHAHPWLALAAAFFLPGVNAIITSRSHTLGTFPFALNFILLVVIASSGDYRPTLVAVAMSSVTRFFILSWTHTFETDGRPDSVRALILLICGLLVCALIRARRRSEAALQQTLQTLHERTDALVASLRASKCASWTLDLNSGQSARWYQDSYEVFGRPFCEIEQMPSLGPLLHPEDRVQLSALRERMGSTAEPIAFEHRVIWPDGDLHWLEMRATRVAGPGCVWRGVTVDITERKLAEAALLRSEKLAAMGRLAATVAHEINNPLEAVTNLLYLATADDQLTPDTRGYLQTAEREVARLGNITRLSLGFVRSGGLRRSLAVGMVIEEVLSIFRHRCEMIGISVERRIDPELMITIAPHELRQIVTNLVSNATDAVSGNGQHGRPVDQLSSIIVTAAPGTGTAGSIHGAAVAVITVEDNGQGIPTHHLHRIFDPFFTTKQDVGTGIGLWVTRELVESNGGLITAVSGELGGGVRTRLRVELPLHPVPDVDPAVAALPYSEASV
jgi:PAS domain S-box-containing protein